MSRRPFSLPPLNALAAFEAAARHGSLLRASEELNVTPGAVSKQVKSLEGELGRSLFLRRHRALELTREGETLAAALRDAFERMSDTLRQVRLSGQSIVTVGSTLAFAHFWLMPRIGGFWSAHQDIVVDHVISDHAQGLERPDIDLRIRYGDGTWPDETAAKLYDDRILAVASPRFARTHAVNTLDEVAALPLLSLDGPDSSWTSWEAFLREVGARSRSLHLRRFNSYVIALQAACSGQGVALGWASLVKPLIAAGELVQITDVAVPAPQSFHVTWSAHRRLSPQAAVLRDWLLAAVD